MSAAELGQTDRDETEPTTRPARRKLGRGLGALLGDAKGEAAIRTAANSAPASSADESKPSSTEGFASLPVAAIEPLPDQPRRRFDEAALADLARSIETRGVIQPVIVRPLAAGRYQLVAGERRWRAAQIARVHEIPALVRELDRREIMALALVENLQREDLNPIEEARAYQRLSEEEGLTQAEIARTVEKSRSHVANLQRLLSLPSPVLDMVEEDTLSMGHARALIGDNQAEEKARRAVAQGLSVRQVEAMVRAERSGSTGSERTRPAARDERRDADIAALQSELEDMLGLRVRIEPNDDGRSGRVTVSYGSIDQLDLVCQRLTASAI